MQLERTHNMQTRPPEFWEMWVKAGEYAMCGQTAWRRVQVQLWRVGAQRPRSRRALMEYYAVFSYVALIYRPDFAPPQRVRMPF